MLSMMTLNICIESYGAVVHVMDSLLGSGLQAQPTRLGPGGVHVGVTSDRVAPPIASGGSRQDLDGPDFDGRVRSAVANLDHGAAQAVWLVDVCGCSYQEAALEIRVDRREITNRVALGRRAIRSHLSAV